MPTATAFSNDRNWCFSVFGCHHCARRWHITIMLLGCLGRYSMKSFVLATNLVYAGLVLIWFGLLKLLFDRLERDHTQKYEAIGRPSLFLRNNIATSIATLRFLFLREHRQLGDRSLSRLADSMLVYLMLFVASVFGLLVALQWSEV